VTPGWGIIAFFEDIIKNILSKLRMLELVKRKLKKYKQKNKLSLSDTTDILQKLINSGERYVCNYVEDENIKKYIKNLYDELLFRKDEEYSKEKLMELCRLINLDLFLRSIFEKNKTESN
jgi:outer membrane translocation and assembly module TamA